VLFNTPSITMEIYICHGLNLMSFDGVLNESCMKFEIQLTEQVFIFLLIYLTICSQRYQNISC
jgi:hypothetical protein